MIKTALTYDMLAEKRLFAYLVAHNKYFSHNLPSQLSDNCFMIYFISHTYTEGKCSVKESRDKINILYNQKKTQALTEHSGFSEENNEQVV